MSELTRYSDTEQVVHRDVTVYGIWNVPEFLKVRPDESFVRRYKVRPETAGHLDLIANELYGSPHLWWVLPAFNGVIDLLGWPKAGTVIEFPADEVVLSQIV